ncbi:Coupling protein TraD [Stieleria neptunia]|uniref:Coupling protein TraD n=1 Tax=Stieleria neptunia TaxID=2527979 RepID=A0A518HSS7_9BACT|nr:type IV secretion system DNA-binding domain-containing protein [Stieleria neptunia]QDV43913.1 Coupling protein TraD [Stieleria neptunia]
MGVFDVLRVALGVCVALFVVLSPAIRRHVRARTYRRGRTRVATKKKAGALKEGGLRWGNEYLPESAATSHFLAVGTTGAGKSLVQKRLMRGPLKRIAPGTDSRAIIFDAKNDVAAFLRHQHVSCPVYTLNPFDASSEYPIAVAWDIAADITSPARALNLATSLIPGEKGGSNQYFTDAARQVVAGVIESFIKHSGSRWTFSDLVYGCLSEERIKELLSRDESGRDVLSGFLGDEKTGYQVATTVFSRMSYFKPVAALWQNAEQKLSIRRWLHSESVLLLGANATTKTSLDAINEQVFRVFVEEVDVQSNSKTRRTWVWMDEARLSGSIVSKSDLLPFLAVKGRSRGVCLVVAFQDIEGLREAAGERVANELVAQLSNKALLRAESDGTATWSSKQIGQAEVLEHHTSDSSGFRQSVSAQRVVRDAVLPSEFFNIPPSSRENGVTGYFLSPHFGAQKVTIPGHNIDPVVVPEHVEQLYAITLQPESAQWLANWSPNDRERLGLSLEVEIAGESGEVHRRRKKAKIRVNHGFGKLQMPRANT